MSTKYIYIFILLILLTPFYSSAQFNINLDATLQDELNVEIIPTYPKPNEMVYIKLDMYSEDLDKAEITWNQDNKILIKENGKKTYNFVSPSSGQETKIEIRVKLQSGKIFYKLITIRPASVDLIWQSNSYVPVFYKGKTLHPKQGDLSIVAMPDFRDAQGNPIPAKSLIFKWSDGNNTYDDQSGYGKNVLRINGSLLGRDERIDVLVTDPNSNKVAFDYIQIPTIIPEVVFYEVSPFYGPRFNKSISDSLKLSGEEIEVFAAPFFASDINKSTTYFNWKLNGISSTELLRSKTVVFRKPEGKSGSSNISLTVENGSKILQETTGSFRINFE